MTRFADRTAVVTGAGGGIGTAIAVRLASEGAHVVVCDAVEAGAASTAQQILDSGGSAETAVFDVACGEEVGAFADRVLGAFGLVDVLVNNAGINRRGPLLDLTDDDWRATMSVNLDSMYHLCRAFLPAMVEARRGAIVNTGSQWGLHPAPGHIAYNVSKAAVIAFSQNLARDYAPSGVRVNVVCPGEILTPMVEANLATKGIPVSELAAKVPYGRLGKPEEVAALVAFLASDEAPYMTGSVVEITGAQAVS
ncbi:MAG TPA: SDR family NAD(P)-dependent oxidoreductase [Candidatus Nanopelagicales bacterium]|nr:SDR family NAD(P)-dependent oxidoreductase [Candidatus Nanopelagicales bacterium]